jgi:hypothetical protein
MGDSQSQIKQAAHPVYTRVSLTSRIQSESSDGVRPRLEERKKREVSSSSNDKDDKSLALNMIESSFRVMQSPKRNVFVENVDGV